MLNLYRVFRGFTFFNNLIQPFFIHFFCDCLVSNCCLSPLFRVYRWWIIDRILIHARTRNRWLHFNRLQTEMCGMINCVDIFSISLKKKSTNQWLKAEVTLLWSCCSGTRGENLKKKIQIKRNKFEPIQRWHIPTCFARSLFKEKALLDLSHFAYIYEAQK